MHRSAALVPVLLALLLLAPVASAYTGPWGITLRDNLGKPIDLSQGIDGGANFTIQISVGSTSVGSARYLVITSSATNASVPLMRRPLGYFDATYNSTRLINVSLSLPSYSSVINPHGDYLHIWVERLGGAIEADTGVIPVKADFDRLIQKQQDFFFGYIQSMQADFASRFAATQNQIQVLQNYILALALLVVFIGVFSARDVLKNGTKAAKTSKATRTAIDSWLKAYIEDHMGAADRAQEEADRQAAASKGESADGT